ncbi:hypothetical protein TNCV_4713511 [Trichonephila clavipes]|nr:hypothetical protein TNCV_4713511 [Trichonephila clavipes]
MVTEDEKWVTYEKIVENLLWSKRCKSSQTMGKPRRYYWGFGGTGNDKKLASREDWENRLLGFFEYREEDFYEREKYYEITFKMATYYRTICAYLTKIVKTTKMKKRITTETRTDSDRGKSVLSSRYGDLSFYSFLKWKL